MNNIQLILQRISTLAQDYDFYNSIGDFSLAQQAQTDWAYFNRKAVNFIQGTHNVA
jgi:hypothetical protein